MEPLITIVATSHNEDNAHSPLIQAMLAQTDPLWKLIVYNNGSYTGQQRPIDNRIIYMDSPTDTGMWGCQNRSYAIGVIDTPYILNTSVQDYYIPTFIQDLNKELQAMKVDIVHWQAINHLFNYSILNGEFAWGHIDWGQWCVRTDIIKRTGIVQPADFSADWHTLQACRQYSRNIVKKDKIYTIHN